MTRMTIEKRQEVVDAIHGEVFAERVARRTHNNGSSPRPQVGLNLDDCVLLDKARAAKNGAQFVALYDRGDISRYHNDDSAADLALCSMLAFWTADASRIDSLFRSSALMREKWHRPDYRSATIAKALDRSVTYNPNYKSPGANVNGNGTAQLSAVNSDSTVQNDNEVKIEECGEAAYHGPAGEFARVVAPYYEGHPVALLAQYLLAYGNTAGRSLYHQIGRTPHYPNLFELIVGETGSAAKGSGQDWVQYQFNQADPFFYTRVHHGLTSGEGLIHHVRDKRTQLRWVGKKGEKEQKEVTVDEGVAEKRSLIFESEFASVLRVSKRDENTLVDVLRLAFDGARILETLPKHFDERATDAHISIVGHITPAEYRQLFDTANAPNGLGNRFAHFIVWRTKYLPRPDVSSEELQSQLADNERKLRQAIEFASVPRHIMFDFEAGQMFDSMYIDLSEPGEGPLASMLQRGRVYVRRFAMIYAALDCSPVIEPIHLEAARTLWSYCSRSVAQIFHGLLGNPDCEKILEALKRSTDGYLTKTAIHKLFCNNFSKERIDNALIGLEKSRKAYRTPVPTGGRPEQRWFTKK